MKTEMKTQKVSCPRCGGTGKVEHTHVVEGVCFMCYGSGVVYPERVEKLTERAIKVKAKKEVRRKEMLEKAERVEKEREERQYNENLTTFHTRINDKNDMDIFCDVALDLVRKMDGMAKSLKFDSQTPEAEIRGMVTDYFNDNKHSFRFAISKWTLETFGFIYMDITKNSPIEGAKDLNNGWYA